MAPPDVVPAIADTATPSTAAAPAAADETRKFTKALPCRRSRLQRLGRRSVSLVHGVGPLHRGVEGDRRGGEVGLSDEGERVPGAVVAVHARVLPLDRQRALVADAV